MTAQLDLDALRALLDDGRCLCSHASTDWGGVAALLDEVATLRAKVAAVEALADGYRGLTEQFTRMAARQSDPVTIASYQDTAENYGHFERDLRGALREQDSE